MRILYLSNSYSQQRQREKKANIYPVRMAMEAEWYRKQGYDVTWGTSGIEGIVRPLITSNIPYILGETKEIKLYDKIITEPENLPFLTLPRPDRVFTRAKEYDSGNYKYKPGTHIMSASGCWWGKCSFCVENKGAVEQGLPTPITSPKYEVRPVEDVINEIEECKSLGFKEVFDDSATFPIGKWLHEFIRLVHARRITMHLGCNARIGSLPFSDMHSAGFRMLLFGIESANQSTLNKINKGVKVEDIIPTIRKASESGISCHGAFMFGYSWESDRDAIKTLRLCHYLLRKGYLKTAQASLYCPQGVSGNQAHKKYVKKIYDIGYSPEFWFNQLRCIRNIDDIKYIWRGIKSGINNYCQP